MERFFGFGEAYYQQFGRFTSFSLEHLLLLGTCLLSWILILIVMRNRDDRSQAYFRKILAVSMLLCELSWYIWYGVQNGLNPRECLPLHLCSLALYSQVFLLFTGRQIAFELAYFLGIGGALQALLTPNLTYHFPHIRFFHFTFIHFALVLVPLYFIFVLHYRITFRSIWRAMGISILFMAFVMVMNQIIGSNYMFINGQPEFPSLIDIFVKIFGPWPYYLIGNLSAAFLVFLVLYLPFGGVTTTKLIKEHKKAKEVR